MSKSGNPTPHHILAEAAETFKAKSEEYGDSYIRVMRMLKILFPNGVHLDCPGGMLRYYLLGHILTKLSRLSVSNITHQDSVRDLIVYAAILESELDHE